MRTDDIADVKRTLWSAADEVRANSRLTPAEFRGPALGLIFLAYAEPRSAAVLVTQILITRLQEPLLLLMICGAFYFVISFPLARFGGYLEKRWSND